MMSPSFSLAFLCFLSAAALQAAPGDVPRPDAPRRYEFAYQVHLDLPREDAKVRLWLPHPAESTVQTINAKKVSAPLAFKTKAEKRFGNRILYFEGTPKARSVDVTVTYDITRKPSDGMGKSAVRKGSPDDPEHYLAPDKKVVLADKIKTIAMSETRPEQTDQQKIRALYDYVVKIMAYDKSGTGWGQGDAIWACDNKRGNCTDFHSLFIALNRSVGVPARFFIGFPIPDTASGEIPGYHCWAEAYAQAVGWIPVDASEAKKSGKPDRYYGYLPPDRIEFSAGRDLVLEPPQAGEPLNYFIYPYAEIDGKPVEGVKREFHFKRLDGKS